MSDTILPARFFPAPYRSLGVLFGRSRRRAIVAYAVVLVLWQLGATSNAWLGHRRPVIGNVPAPRRTSSTPDESAQPTLLVPPLPTDQGRLFEPDIECNTILIHSTPGFTSLIVGPARIVDT